MDLLHNIFCFWKHIHCSQKVRDIWLWCQISWIHNNFKKLLDYVMKVGQLRRQMLMLKFFVMILFFRKLIILETTPKTKNSRVSISGHVTSRVNHSLKLKSRTVHWSIYGLLRYRNPFFMNGSPQLNKVLGFRLTSFNTCARQIP